MPETEQQLLDSFQRVVSMMAISIRDSPKYKKLEEEYRRINTALYEIEFGRKLSKAEVDELDRAEAAEWDEDEEYEEGD
jgi:hypothetical protein